MSAHTLMIVLLGLGGSVLAYVGALYLCFLWDTRPRG